MSDENKHTTGEATGQSCKGCWWQEGGRCYVEPCQRRADGRSEKLAVERCDQFAGKRDVLSQVIPGDKLVIVSEGSAAAIEKATQPEAP